jgi:hypothetical protein
MLCDSKNRLKEQEKFLPSASGPENDIVSEIICFYLVGYVETECAWYVGH